MLHGVELGARTLELDCVISADGKVVVSHDVFMSSDIMLKPDGSAIGKGEEKQYALYRMTYDSIRRFPEGVKPHPRFPGQTTALLVENSDGFAKNIERPGFTPSIYSPNYLLVNADLIKEAHDHKVAVLPWTVNTEPDMKAMAALGVDGIISDYPDRLVRLFGSYQKP